MTRVSTLLFLMGTVAVACNGAVIKGRPCEHYSDEEIKPEEHVLVDIPEAPMLPPLSTNTLQFITPLQDEIKSEIPEATPSLPSVPLSYQPISIASGDYAWPTASLYPEYPVNVLVGQAALDYPNVQVVPIAATAESSHREEETLMSIPEAPVLPAFEPGMVLNYSESEAKEQLPASPEVPIAAAPLLPSWASMPQLTPHFLPYQQMYSNSRDESSSFNQLPWSYYPIAPIPCEHMTGSSPAMLPFYAPVLAPEAEYKPVSTSFPEAPIFPSFSISELPITNTVDIDNAPAKEDKKVDPVLMIIPEAPLLPPFVAPEIPKEEITSTPILEKEVPSISQNDEKIETVEPCDRKVELLLIPEAPVLPPFDTPELHLSVSTTEEPKHEFDELPEVTEAQPVYYVPIPEAPVLPAFVAPEQHLNAESEVPAKDETWNGAVPESEPLLIIPEAPVLPPFTAPAAVPIAAPMYDEPKPEPALPCEEPTEEKYENFVPIVIPTAPILPPFLAPEIPMKYEKEHMPVLTEASAPTEVLFEEPEKEAQPLIPIPAAPLLPTFVAPEMPTLQMYDEPKSEDCDKNQEHKPVAITFPYYLPIPANYALSAQSLLAMPESAESMAECIRKLLAYHMKPSLYANLEPAMQGMQKAPIVPPSSPFYYAPRMSNGLPVY